MPKIVHDSSEVKSKQSKNIRCDLRKQLIATDAQLAKLVGSYTPDDSGCDVCHIKKPRFRF